VKERLLTVMQTYRIQGRDPIEFLTEAITAYRKGLPAPCYYSQKRIDSRKLLDALKRIRKFPRHQ